MQNNSQCAIDQENDRCKWKKESPPVIGSQKKDPMISDLGKKSQKEIFRVMASIWEKAGTANHETKLNPNGNERTTRGNCSSEISALEEVYSSRSNQIFAENNLSNARGRSENQAKRASQLIKTLGRLYKVTVGIGVTIVVKSHEDLTPGWMDLKQSLQKTGFLGVCWKPKQIKWPQLVDKP